MNIRKIVLVVLVTVMAASCSLSKYNKQVRVSVSGSWTITDITFDQEGIFNAVAFNDVNISCLVGSDWFFNGNNSTGTYTIKGDEKCANGMRYIRWSVLEKSETEAQLQFKFTDERKKDVNPYGYRLDITTLNPETMVLESRVTVDGSPITLIYTFKRTTF